MCIAQALSHVCPDKRGIVCPTSSSLFHAGQAASAVGWGLKKNKQPVVSLEWLSLANGLLSNRACSLGLAKISALQNCLLALVITASLRRYDLMVVWLLNALHILKTTRLPHGLIEETSRMVSTLAVFLRRTTGDSSTVTITAAKLSYSLLLHSPHVGHDLDKEMQLTRHAVLCHVRKRPRLHIALLENFKTLNASRTIKGEWRNCVFLVSLSAAEVLATKTCWARQEMLCNLCPTFLCCA